jgi:hypothetical protein
VRNTLRRDNARPRERLSFGLTEQKRGFGKTVCDLEVHVRRIERAIVEGAQIVPPEEIEATRAALVKTAQWLLGVAEKIEDIVHGEMIGSEEGKGHNNQEQSGCLKKRVGTNSLIRELGS